MGKIFDFYHCLSSWMNDHLIVPSQTYIFCHKFSTILRKNAISAQSVQCLKPFVPIQRYEIEIFSHVKKEIYVLLHRKLK